MFWKKESHIAKNIIVGLDFDGVLAHGLKAKLKYAKELFGLDLRLNQTKEEGFNKLVQSLGLKINYRSLMDPVNEKHIMEYEVPPNCVDVIKKLYEEGFRFVIVTSRNNHDYPYAKLFVEKYFNGVIKKVYNTRNEPKDRFVYKLKARAYVDDDLKKLIELENTSARLIYYRQAENKHIDLPLSMKTKCIEIYDWVSFYKIIHQLKEIHEAICWFHNLKNNIFNLKEIDKHYKNMSLDEIKELIRKYRLKKHWH